MTKAPQKSAPRNTNNDMFQRANMEYAQLCQNIREGWTHITTLLRQFLFVQVLLISLVGLGNTAITAIKAIASDDVPVVGIKQSDKKSTNPDQSNTQQSKTLNEKRLTRFARYSSTISYSVLVLIGISISFGARVQSNRLFLNCKSFVQRAAAIEEKFSVGNLDFGKSENIEPVHIYMFNRLENTELTSMQQVLSVVYICGGLLWIGIGVVLALPFLQSL